MLYYIRCFLRWRRNQIDGLRRAAWTPAEGDCVEYLENPRLGVWLPNEKRQATDDELSGRVLIVSVDGEANRGVVPSGYGWTLQLRLACGLSALDQYFRKQNVRVLSLGKTKSKR